MSFKRTDRINQLLQEEICRVLTRGLRVPLGLVTITAVKITPDLREARVFWSLLGSEEEKEKTQLILTRASGFIRRSIRGRVRLRYLPNLIFLYDVTEEKAARISEIFQQIEQEKTNK